MTAFAVDEIRRLIPRWRFTDQSYATEFASDPRVRQPLEFSNRHLEEKLADWQLSKSIGTAIDVVSCGVGGNWLTEVLPAAKYLASQEDQLTLQVKTLIQQVLEPLKQINIVQPSIQVQNSSDSITFANARDRVALARRRLHNNPRNMLYWLDLSRGYAILGQTDKAIIAVERALYLSPYHRHSLRVAARLFVLAGKPDRALGLLTKNPRTPTDPWLMAAEISIASIAEKHPRFARKGRSLIESGGLPPEHLTELQSALATLDLFGGAERRVRKLLHASMESPTENSVAQARWISTQLSGIAINKSNFDLPFNFEARCWRALEQGKWKQASDECMNWLLDEPFSSRPARVGSLIGISLTNDYNYAEMCAHAGLQADPDDSTLLNNLAVTLAYQGKLLEAVEEFRRIDIIFDSVFPSYVYLATAGLLQFRMGNIEEGRQLYARAESMAPSNSKTRVAVFRAREELKAKTSTSTEYFESVKARSKKTPISEVDRILELLEAQSSSFTSNDSKLSVDDNLIDARDQMSLILSSSKVKALI